MRNTDKRLLNDKEFSNADKEFSNADKVFPTLEEVEEYLKQDEDKIRLLLGIIDGKIKLNFGDRPVKWIAFTPDQAARIAYDILVLVKKLTVPEEEQGEKRSIII
jgi:hypothetical protein